MHFLFVFFYPEFSALETLLLKISSLERPFKVPQANHFQPGHYQSYPGRNQTHSNQVFCLRKDFNENPTKFTFSEPCPYQASFKLSQQQLNRVSWIPNKVRYLT